MSGGAFPRTERLRRSGEFQAVFRKGQPIERPELVLLWCAGGRTHRAGFAVSRQIRGAVRRNRARRRLREAYRRARHSLPAGIQMVLVAREAILTSPFAEVVRGLETAVAAIVRCQGAPS